MTNKKQQRADIIENTIERYNSDLMFYIQQHVINEFMDTDVDDKFYINNEEEVHNTFNSNIFLGQQVVENYMNSNMRGLSIKDVDGVLYEYNQLVGIMDLDTEDNIGSMVNCIMLDIANTFSHALNFE